MDRKYNLKLDLQFRCNNSKMIFNEFDNDTSDFFMRITRGGELFNIDKAIVALCVIKPDGSSDAEFINIKEGKVYANLPNNLKDIPGTYKAKALLVLNNEKVVVGPIEYEVDQDNIISQVNREVQDDNRFTILTDMINRLSIVENAEELRKQAEISRAEAEKLREQAIEKIKEDTTKLISDTKKEIAEYKNAKDTAIDNDLKQFKEATNQAIEEYKSNKDTEINNILGEYKTNTTDDIEEFKSAKSQELDNFKNTKNTELDNYKREKDLAINQYVESKNLEINDYVAAKNRELDEYKGAKDKEIDQYKNTKDKLINNKITEVESAKQNIISTANNKISEMDQAKTNMQNSVNAKLEEADNRISELQNFETQLEAIESKNIEQDNRLKEVEYKNKVQDVYISGLFNENNDKRLSIEGEGNSLKLEGSKEGLATVDKVVGNTTNNILKKYQTNSIGQDNSKWDYSIDVDGFVTLTGKGEFVDSWCGIISPLSAQSDIIKNNRTYTVIIDFQNLTNIAISKGLVKTETSFDLINPFSLTNNCLIYTFNTNNNIDTNSVILAGFTTGEMTQSSKMQYKVRCILEGDYTNKPIPSEYFEGMQSTFEECKVTQQMVDSGEESVENLGKYKCNVKVRGKNLFDKSKLLLNTLSTYGGYLYSKESDLTLTITDKNTNVDISNIYFGFSKDRSPSKTNWVVSNGAILLNGVRNNTFDNDKLMFVSFYPKTQNTIDKLTARFNIQLEEGTQATPYEPYFSRTQTVYLNSPLLKGDEIVCKEDGLYHYHKMWAMNLKEATVNGTIWNYDGIVRGEHAFWCNTLTYDKGKSYITLSQDTMCDKNSSVSQGNAINIRFKDGVLSSNDDAGVKAWVEANNPIVAYEIKEPYYEKISDDKLLLEIPSSATLSVESAIPCQSISASYTGNVPSLYGMENSILEIEEHNVDMVATTFDMDYRLLEVEWALEDAGLVGISLASTFNSNRKGEKTMALSRYEQAKIMILGGAYDKATLTKQLTRYLEKGLVTKEEYDELIALMEAKELVTGK